MTQPVVLAVDDDGEVLAAFEQALRRRYGADYQVLAESLPSAPPPPRCRCWSGCATRRWRSR